MTPSILLLENDPIYRDFLTQRLSVFGYAVTTTDQPETALETAKKQPQNLVIIDLSGPSIQAVILTKKLRNEGVTCPIMVLSQDDHIDAVEKATQSGVSDYVIKPFELNVLMSKIRTLVSGNLTG
jgi:two-component system KDP operon response regulator KdpE